MAVVAALAVGLVAGCGQEPAANGIDSGSVDAGEPTDAGTTDGGEQDAGTIDAGGLDGGPRDGGNLDAGGPVDAGPVDAGRPDSGPNYGDGGEVRVRLMAGNITSGNCQSYDPGHGTRIFQGLKPDIAMVQEMNYGCGSGSCSCSNSATALRSFVDSAFGPEYVFARGNGQIPNGVVSRFPIVASGIWTDPEVSNRDFTWARIDIPGPADLWVVSVHLLTSSGSDRNKEARALVTKLQAEVPATDFVAVGGDFNTDTRNEACFTTLREVFSVASPYPKDQAGKEGTNAGRSKPYDGVYVSSGLHALETAVVLGTNSHAGGLVVDTRVYTPLTAIAPAVRTDSDASNMQHMAVVRDFLVRE